MATSMATAATGMPQHSPDSWADSPMESPNTTFHQKPNGVGAGVGAGASYFSGGKATPKPPMGFSQPQHQPAGWQPPPSAASPHLGGPAISPTPLSNPHQAPPAEAVRSDTSPTAPGMQDQVTTSEYSSVVEMIKSANPSTLRQALRDHWDQCFMGSDYHVAFILNAILHQATPSVLSRSVQDFGGPLVHAALPQLINHCGAAELDTFSDQIMSKLSPQFLDRALARRLETIDARNLVNALARAERLGYDVSDIVVERTADKPEQVVPSLQGVVPPDYAATIEQSKAYQPAQGQAQPQVQAPISHQQSLPSPQIQAKRKDADWMRGLPPLPQVGPAGVVYCGDCRRPCSGPDALAMHKKKASCDPWFRFDRLGKTICPHCGQGFTSATGVHYHMKVGVCGHYNDEVGKVMHSELESYTRLRELRLVALRAAQNAQIPSPAIPQQGSQPQTTPVPAPALKHQVRQPQDQQIGFSSKPQPAAPQPSMSKTPSNVDPIYAHLNPETLQRFQNDVAQVEEKYGRLMRQALKMQEPEKSREMAKWKNCYNTKQSVTRKKYGIRLREKRTVYEIEAERRRLLGDDGPELWAEMERSAKRVRTDDMPSSQADSPSVRGNSMVQPTQIETPRKRVALADMGGLSGSVGSAEMTDPTALLTSSQPRGLAHLEQTRASMPQSQLPPGATLDDPMSIAEDSHGENPNHGQGNHSNQSDDGDSSEPVTD